MHYVYLLRLANNDIYKGSTSDLRIRISEHQNGKVQSTKNFRPIKLIDYEAYLLKTDALRREKFLKTTEGKRLLKQQYRDALAFTGSPSHSTGRGVE
jgi:putative endonuclease